MAKLICISGPCGGGKTTFSEKLARRFSDESGKTVYLLHGDSFHRGFVEPQNKGDFFAGGTASDSIHWQDILRFNWDCIFDTAGRALKQGLDVIIDYVIEDEFPKISDLSKRQNAELYYVVLTADESELERRIRQRGDLDMLERAVYLKKKLEAEPENQKYLYDNTGKSAEEAASEFVLDNYRVI